MPGAYSYGLYNEAPEKFLAALVVLGIRAPGPSEARIRAPGPSEARIRAPGPSEARTGWN